MGGGSNSSSRSKSVTSYRKTTTSNPYVVSKTTNKGTTTELQPNTVLSSVYDFSNANLDSLLHDLINPSLDSTTNQAKMGAYRKTIGEETQKALENNIITPLAKRNMIRSSQATDMYNNLQNKQNDMINDYATSLLSSSQNDTADIINNLMNLAFQGYNVISGNQAQSLQTSAGNAIKTSSGSTSGTRYGM